ncbi:hypothetical protein EDD86DRAFT_186262 [Gorgonomyces haynaldii]|nr:hypothetical protein EDD86DRAFT_186262 [Gorgonomyces haynaldii]
MSNLVEKLTNTFGKQLCQSCIQRHCGIRQASLSTKEFVCQSCTGLLQQDFIQLSQKAMEKYKEQQFELQDDTFSVSVQMPTTYSIRQHCYKTLLEETQEGLEMVDIKEIFKMSLREAFAQTSGKTFDVNSPLSLVVKMEHPETELEFMFLPNVAPKFEFKQKRAKGRTVYQGASGEKIAGAIKNVTAAQLREHDMYPPVEIQTLAAPSEIYFEHSQIYVAGRYCKLQRHISNSAWIINGKRMTEHSVEELIGEHVKEHFRAANYKFSSAGREDADVLMLNDGRPFYFELVQPRKITSTPEEMLELQKKINEAADGKITIRDFQRVTRDDTWVLKNSATTKSKSYRCRIQLAEPRTVEEIMKLDGLENIPVSQKNPTRVPRRADLTRDKVVEKMNITIEDASDEKATILAVDLQTSAGTYVKEFMHSDQGRTEPSIKSMLNVEVTVLSLDVLQVFLDWPPRIEQ